LGSALTAKRPQFAEFIFLFLRLQEDENHE
jgi:hypothetical protein